jgi:hypothetical protein
MRHLQMLQKQHRCDSSSSSRRISTAQRDQNSQARLMNTGLTNSRLLAMQATLRMSTTQQLTKDTSLSTPQLP